MEVDLSDSNEVDSPLDRKKHHVTLPNNPDAQEMELQAKQTIEDRIDAWLVANDILRGEPEDKKNAYFRRKRTQIGLALIQQSKKHSMELCSTSDFGRCSFVQISAKSSLMARRESMKDPGLLAGFKLNPLNLFEDDCGSNHGSPIKEMGFGSQTEVPSSARIRRKKVSQGMKSPNEPKLNKFCSNQPTIQPFSDETE